MPVRFFVAEKQPAGIMRGMFGRHTKCSKNFFCMQKTDF